MRLGFYTLAILLIGLNTATAEVADAPALMATDAIKVVTSEDERVTFHYYAEYLKAKACASASTRRMSDDQVEKYRNFIHKHQPFLLQDRKDAIWQATFRETQSYRDTRELPLKTCLRVEGEFNEWMNEAQNIPANPF